jgi:hypothetical protein
VLLIIGGSFAVTRVQRELQRKESAKRGFTRFIQAVFIAAENKSWQARGSAGCDLLASLVDVDTVCS